MAPRGEDNSNPACDRRRYDGLLGRVPADRALGGRNAAFINNLA
jgi:hypothetical protein